VYIEKVGAGAPLLRKLTKDLKNIYSSSLLRDRPEEQGIFAQTILSAIS